jgi:hypothetical protein
MVTFLMCYPELAGGGGGGGGVVPADADLGKAIVDNTISEASVAKIILRFMVCSSISISL